MIRTAVAIIAALGVGAVAGRLGVAGHGGNDARGEIAWEPVSAPVMDAATRAARFEALMATGQFGETSVAVEGAGAGETGPAAEAEMAPPRLAATMALDGRVIVSVIHADGRIMSGAVGEDLGDGWVVEAAGLREATIVRNGKEARIPLLLYLETKS